MSLWNNPSANRMDTMGDSNRQPQASQNLGFPPQGGQRPQYRRSPPMQQGGLPQPGSPSGGFQPGQQIKQPSWGKAPTEIQGQKPYTPQPYSNWGQSGGNMGGWGGQQSPQPGGSFGNGQMMDWRNQQGGGRAPGGFGFEQMGPQQTRDRFEPPQHRFNPSQQGGYLGNMPQGPNGQMSPPTDARSLYGQSYDSPPPERSIYDTAFSQQGGPGDMRGSRFPGGGLSNQLGPRPGGFGGGK